MPRYKHGSCILQIEDAYPGARSDLRPIRLPCFVEFIYSHFSKNVMYFLDPRSKRQILNTRGWGFLAEDESEPRFAFDLTETGPWERARGALPPPVLPPCHAATFAYSKGFLVK